MAKKYVEVLLIILLPILVFLYCANIAIICIKKSLRKPIYFLMLNCSVSDCLCTVISCLSVIFTTDGNVIVNQFATWFYYSSVVSTFLLALDRFIAMILIEI